jgi:4-hydroxy-tetrahydrodipicolinate reductase
LVEETEGLELAGRYDVANIAELDEAAPAVDLVIDFSQPAALSHVAAYVERTGASLVSGTTGLGASDFAQGCCAFCTAALQQQLAVDCG